MIRKYIINWSGKRSLTLMFLFTASALPAQIGRDDAIERGRHMEKIPRGVPYDKFVFGVTVGQTTHGGNTPFKLSIPALIQSEGNVYRAISLCHLRPLKNP